MNGSRWAGGLLVAALIVASLGALIINQRTRASGLLIDAIHVNGDIAPDGDGVDDSALIRFRVDEADRVDVTLLDPAGEAVRKLTEATEVGDGQVVRLTWDGINDQGALVGRGTYTLRIRLHARGRTITPGETIAVEEDED